MKKTNFVKNRKEVKQMKKIGLIAMMALMAIILVGLAYGTNTCLVTGNNASDLEWTAGYIKGTRMFALNITAWEAIGDASNVSSANFTTSEGLLCSVSIPGLNATRLNCSANTLNLTDTTTYTITGTMMNATGGSLGTCTASKVPDNTIPICTWSQSSSTTYPSNIVWAILATNASTCGMTIGGRTMTPVLASGNCTHSGKIPEGHYATIEGYTNDGRNRTDCSITRIQIDDENKEAGLLAIDTEEKAQKISMRTIVLVLLFAGLAYYFTKKDK